MFMQTQYIKHTFILASLMLVALGSQAAAIYQWQDADGVTHFSDAPPAKTDAASELNSFELETDFPDVQDPEENYYSISQQWERAKEDRLAREQLKLEREKLRTTRLQQQQNVQLASEEPRRTYFPVFSPAFNSRFVNPRLFNQQFPGRFNNNFGTPFQGNFSGRPGRPGKMNASPAPIHRGYVGNVARTASMGN